MTVGRVAINKIDVTDIDRNEGIAGGDCQRVGNGARRGVLALDSVRLRGLRRADRLCEGVFEALEALEIKRTVVYDGWRDIFQGRRDDLDTSSIDAADRRGQCEAGEESSTYQEVLEKECVE